MKVKFQHPALTHQGKQIVFELNGHFEVCPECEGYGHTDRRDIDTSALVDSMREDGDLEGIESYYKGAYDQVCTQCKGNRVVAVPNEGEITEDMLLEIESYEDYKRESAAEREAERRMGA